MQGWQEAECRGADLLQWATDLLSAARQVMTQLGRQLATCPRETSWDKQWQYACRLGVATRHVEVALHVLAYVCQDRTMLHSPLQSTPEAPLGAIVTHGLALARNLRDETLLRTLDCMLADMLAEVPSLTEGQP